MMLRPSHLPPRCPLKNKCLRTRSLDSSYQIPQGDDELLVELFRCPSQDSLLEEHPSWLDDLLTDSDTSPRGVCHRRSSSDSLTIFQEHISLKIPTPPTALPDVVICESQDCEGSTCGTGLETNCVYGPNSPRQRSKLTNSESAIVNALLEKVPPNKLQYVEILSGGRIHEPNTEGNAHSAAYSGEPESEKASRSPQLCRRSGQRSRVRKLQHISDLQKTVESLQTMGAELAAKVASLFQQRVALLLENKSLLQQIALLRHEKIIKDGEHQYLKNEAERLKMISGQHQRRKSDTSFEPGPWGSHSRASWKSLDFRKLNLDGGPVPVNHGLGH